LDKVGVQLVGVKMPAAIDPGQHKPHSPDQFSLSLLHLDRDLKPRLVLLQGLLEHNHQGQSQHQPDHHFHTHLSDGKHCLRIGRVWHLFGFDDLRRTVSRSIEILFPSNYLDKSPISQLLVPISSMQWLNCNGYELLLNENSKDGSLRREPSWSVIRRFRLWPKQV
jgi:hypothetical protein